MYDSPTQNVQVIHDLEMKSKSGKVRARLKLTITIPANPNIQNSSLNVPKSPKTSVVSNALKRASSPFRNRRGGSFRSSRSSGAGSRNSLDSAGFETNQESIEILVDLDISLG